MKTMINTKKIILLMVLLLVGLIVCTTNVSADSLTEPFDNYNNWIDGTLTSLPTNPSIVDGKSCFYASGNNAGYMIKTNKTFHPNNFVYKVDLITTGETLQYYEVGLLGNDNSHIKFGLRDILTEGISLYQDGTLKASAAHVFTKNTTYHVTIERSNGNLTLYLNDSFIFTTPITMAASSYRLTLGRYTYYRPEGSTNYYDNLYYNDDGLPTTSAVIMLSDGTNNKVYVPGYVTSNLSYYYLYTNSTGQYEYTNTTVHNINDTYFTNAYILGSVPLDTYVNYTFSCSGYTTVTSSVLLTQSPTQTIYVPMYKNNSAGAYNLIFGYCNDQIGYHIPGLPMWLENYTTGAIIDYTTSDEPGGYYSLKAPNYNYPYKYKIVVNYPGYGNLTSDIYDSGSYVEARKIGDGITWKANNPYEGDPANGIDWESGDISVDALLSLHYTPNASTTPASSVYVPDGYYAYQGYVKDISNSNYHIPGVPLYMNYPNGTLYMTTTSDANGNYIFLFPNNVPSGYYEFITGSTSAYVNTTAGSYPAIGSSFVNIPYTYTHNNVKSITSIKWLNPNPNYVSYHISGYVKDSAKTWMSIGNCEVQGKYSNGTVFSTVYTDTSGFYTISIPAADPSVYYNASIGIRFFNLSYSVSGYDSKDIPFMYPDVFVNTGTNNITYNVYLDTVNPSLANGLFQITIKDYNSKALLSGVLVKFVNQSNGTIMYTGVTDSNGYLEKAVAPGYYYVKVSKNGYLEVTYAQSINVNVVQMTFELVPYVAPATITPTATATPSDNNPINAMNPIEAFIQLFMALGMDRATARTVLGFLLVIAGALAMAAVVSKFNIEDKGILLMGMGAAAGFATACMLPDGTGTTLWPQWFLLLAGIGVVVAFAGMMYSRRGGS